MVVYQAPSEENVQPLMDRFLNWYNNERPDIPKFIGASLAHYFFLAIHPFRDGNGRFARMLADKALCDNNTFRPFSMSSTINSNKGLYYDYLDKAHKGALLQYIEFMLKLQESTLDDALFKARKVVELHEWLKESPHDFNSAEKAILYEMTLGDRQYWTFFEATKHMWDGDASGQAWSSLLEKGVIKNGNIVLEEHPETRATPA